MAASSFVIAASSFTLLGSPCMMWDRSWVVARFTCSVVLQALGGKEAMVVDRFTWRVKLQALGGEEAVVMTRFTWSVVFQSLGGEEAVVVAVLEVLQSVVECL